MIDSCVLCGSDKTELKASTRTTSVQFSDHFEVEVSNVFCKTCGADYSRREDDDIIEESYTKAQKNAAVNIINYLRNEKGLNLAGVEVGLQIGQRTLANVLEGAEVSRELYALLRIVRLNPWILVSNSFEEAVYKFLKQGG